MRMYSLYDSKSMQYTHPFGQINDACAIRVVQNDMTRKDTLVGQNPEDFTIVYLGEFDEKQGILIPSVERTFLRDCVTLVGTSGAA